ncbi:hypothetical protein ABBQ38_000668 [Trebouxia sp. C0009 RCD-2024]
MNGYVNGALPSMHQCNVKVADQHHGIPSNNTSTLTDTNLKGTSSSDPYTRNPMVAQQPFCSMMPVETAIPGDLCAPYRSPFSAGHHLTLSPEWRVKHCTSQPFVCDVNCIVVHMSADLQ